MDKDRAMFSAESNLDFLVKILQSIKFEVQNPDTYDEAFRMLEELTLGCRLCRNVGHPWNEACRV